MKLSQTLVASESRVYDSHDRHDKSSLWRIYCEWSDESLPSHAPGNVAASLGSHGSPGGSSVDNAWFVE